MDAESPSPYQHRGHSRSLVIRIKSRFVLSINKSSACKTTHADYMLLSLAPAVKLRLSFFYPARPQSIFLINQIQFLLSDGRKNMINSTTWTEDALFFIACCTDAPRNWFTVMGRFGKQFFLSNHVTQFNLKQTSHLCSQQLYATRLTCATVAQSGSNHLQRVSVCLRHHNCDAVRETHSQLLPEHGQKAPLTVAMVTEDDADSLRWGVQHFMVGHLTWTAESM